MYCIAVEEVSRWNLGGSVEGRCFLILRVIAKHFEFLSDIGWLYYYSDGVSILLKQSHCSPVLG